MDHETLIELTAEVVSAHVGHNRVDAAELRCLIQGVYDALAGAGQPAQEIEARPEPAVSILSSVKPDAIACLERGRKMKMLKRHLSVEHGLLPADYRGRWGLPNNYPMVAPDYSAKRQEMAKKIGLGRKPDAKVVRSPSNKAAAIDAQ